jgi:hypothetical protein
MFPIASPARLTAASVAATNDRPSGNSRSSEVWLKNTRRSTPMPEHQDTDQDRRHDQTGILAHDSLLRRPCLLTLQPGQASAAQLNRERMGSDHAVGPIAPTLVQNDQIRAAQLTIINQPTAVQIGGTACLSGDEGNHAA